MNNHHPDFNDPIHGVFGPKDKAPVDPNQMGATARDNDKNRVVGTTVNNDGTFSHYSSGVQQGDVSHLFRDPNGTFSRIADRNGSGQRYQDMTPDSVVTIDGLGTMKLAHAEDAGFVTRNPDGSYVLGQGGSTPPHFTEAADQEQRQDDDEQEHPDLKVERLDDAAEAAFSELVQHTDGGTQFVALSELIETGEVSARTLGAAASQMGIEPDQVSAKMAPVIEAMTEQANAGVAEAGVDPEAVWEWAWDNEPDALKDAMHHHATKGNRSRYAPLVQAYVRDLAKSDPQTILNAELGPNVKSIRQDEQGRIILEGVDGRTYEWSSAVRAGIVRLGR